jgi:excisionase family DNA binding protein
MTTAVLKGAEDQFYGAVDFPGFGCVESACEVAEAAGVDGSHLVDQHQGPGAVHLDLGAEDRRLRAGGRGECSRHPRDGLADDPAGSEFLNVSRPYLVKLLESGEIPFRMVGTHRRVRFRDLSEYASRDDLVRRRAVDELTQLTQDLGLYWAMTFTVVCDANVLYPNTLRDLLIRIAQSGMV